MQITIVFVTICSVQENVKYTNEDAGDSTFNQKSTAIDIVSIYCYYLVKDTTNQQMKVI
jgi:archaellum component FlaF (FlaF/FlaG flagellin family)